LVFYQTVSPDSFNRDCAKVHNYYRRKHKTGSLSISKTVFEILFENNLIAKTNIIQAFSRIFIYLFLRQIVEYAEKRAEEMRITDNFGHFKG
jgi:hypothetical protein